MNHGLSKTEFCVTVGNSICFSQVTVFDTDCIAVNDWVVESDKMEIVWKESVIVADISSSPPLPPPPLIIIIIIIIVVVVIIIIIIIICMQGIYTYIPETNYVRREYSVAAILLLLFMVLISLVSVLNLL